ncbi:MAG: NfeD family protein [Planctomycetota bacterium]
MDALLANKALTGMGLMAVSVLLVLAELFIPSAGVLGLTAAVVGLAGVVVLFFAESSWWGFIGLGIYLAMIPFSLWFLYRVWPDTPIGRRMIHGSAAPDADEQREAQAAAEKQELQTLLGAEGVARTDLRPVGTIEVDGQRMDALAETTLIDAGTRVKITSVAFNEIKVRPLSRARRYCGRAQLYTRLAAVR